MLIIGNGRLLTFWDAMPYSDNAAVAIDGSRVAEIGSCDELRRKYPLAKFIDAAGGIIMPGFINTHTHFGRAFARGDASLANSGSSFEINRELHALENRLGLVPCLDSAYAVLAESIKRGVTTVIDMQSSYLDPRGTLFTIAGAVGEFGIRAGLGFAVRGSEGREKMQQAIAENIEFIDFCDPNRSDMIRPLFAIDSLYSMDDSDLEGVMSLLNGRALLNIELSDGPDDSFHSRHGSGRSPAQRLSDLGILNENTLLAHCGCLSEDEAELIAKSGASVSHTPVSDMFKTDVQPDIQSLLERGVTVGIGTDCVTNDMLYAARCSMPLMRRSCFKDAFDMLVYGSRSIASKLFGEELGIIKPGVPADMIVMDYDPYTEINENNAYLHVMQAMSGAQCRHAIVNGRLILRGRKLLPAVEKYLCKRIRKSSDLVNNQAE